MVDLIYTANSVHVVFVVQGAIPHGAQIPPWMIQLERRVKTKQSDRSDETRCETVNLTPHIIAERLFAQEYFKMSEVTIREKLTVDQKSKVVIDFIFEKSTKRTMSGSNATEAKNMLTVYKALRWSGLQVFEPPRRAVFYKFSNIELSFADLIGAA